MHGSARSCGPTSLFGEVCSGYEEVIKKCEALGSGGGKTDETIVINDCGVL